MAKQNISDIKILAGLISGPALFALCTLLLPESLFAYEARAAIGTLCWMGCWWVMMPIPVGVTGFIPIIVNALFSLMDMDALLSKYATDTIFLLIGADLLTISWKATGLDRRIALRFLYLSGPSLTSQVLMWFLISTAFAMVLPNLVVCSMLTPIAFSMLRYVGEDDLKEGVIAPIILCAVAWGSGLGGMATPFSGAMNLVAIGYIEELIGQEFMYTAWSFRMIPVLIAVTLANTLCILLIKPKNADLKGSREYYKKLCSDCRIQHRIYDAHSSPCDSRWTWLKPLIPYEARCASYGHFGHSHLRHRIFLHEDLAGIQSLVSIKKRFQSHVLRDRLFLIIRTDISVFTLSCQCL